MGVKCQLPQSGFLQPRALVAFATEAGAAPVTVTNPVSDFPGIREFFASGVTQTDLLTT